MTSFLVLSLHSSPWSEPGTGDAGGMNVYVRHTCAELVAAGHTVRCLTLPRAGEVALPDPPSWLHELALPLAEVPKADLPDHLDAMVEAASPHAADADVIIAHYWLSAEVGRRLAARHGLELLTMFHTTAAAKNATAGPDERPEPRARLEAEERAARASRVVVVNSAAEARACAEHLGLPQDRFAVIAPGIDHDVFHDRNAVKSSGTALTLGLAGRLQPLKGPQILLRALNLLDDDTVERVWLIGDGSPQFLDHLRALADDRVEFLGRLAPDALADRMRRADVWTVPSSSETFGLVAVEAQACGTPVLATDVGGLPDAVVGGWLVPDRDPETWAAALRHAAQNPQERLRLAEKGVDHTARLTWRATADRWAELTR